MAGATIGTTIKRRINYILFLVTLAGLLVLLVLPVVQQYRYEQSRDDVDRWVDPAKLQVFRACQVAYEARDFAYAYYFLRDKAPRPQGLSPAGYYAALRSEWVAITSHDEGMGFCGPDVLSAWRSGVRSMSAWLNDMGPRAFNGKEVSKEDLQRSTTLFGGAITDLVSARTKVESVQASLLDKKHASRQANAAMVLALGLGCGVLAFLAGWNVQRLNRIAARERLMEEHLEIATREIQDRVRNNLQVISAMVDLQLADAGRETPGKGLINLASQVRAVSAAHESAGSESRPDTVRADRLLQRLATMRSGYAVHAQVQVDQTVLSLKQATAVALIVNALLQSTARHGAGSLCIELHGGNELVRFNSTESAPTSATGTLEEDRMTEVLLQTLVSHDLHGTMSIQPPRDEAQPGITITFPRFRT